MAEHHNLFEEDSDDVGTAVVTSGPVKGMVEIVLILQGTGWSITEMENIDTGLPEDQPYTRIVLSK
jgi:hypothetical protein